MKLFPLQVIASLALFSLNIDASATNSLHFLAIGDWGKGGVNGDITTTFSAAGTVDLGPTVEYQQDILEGNSNTKGKDGGGGNQKKTYTYQVAIAGAMSRWVSQRNLSPEFILPLGDNFYDNGVLSINDTPWTTHWKNVYLQNHTNLRVPWYPIFGNHDYGYGQQGLQAQMDRSDTDDFTDNLWQFPSTNYSKLFAIPGGGSVGIVFVDTTTLAPSQNKCCNENGGVSVEEQQARIDNQISHLHTLFKEITQYNPTWLLVAGHYPIFSRGEHGDMSELVANLLPLLVQYNVSLYLCGHDHISEHLQAYGIEFFVSGAGAMTSYLATSSEAAYLWSGTGYSAFTSFEATLEKLNVVYVRYDDTVVYNYTLWTNSSAHRWQSPDQDDDGRGHEGGHDDDDHADDDEAQKLPLPFLPGIQFDENVLKVLGVAGVFASALILIAIAFFISKRQSYSSSQSVPQTPISPSSSRSNSSLVPHPLPTRKKNHQREKKKQSQQLHSFPLHDDDDDSQREDKKLLQLSQCSSQEKKCLTSSLHSPRTSASNLSLPYPKGVAATATASATAAPVSGIASPSSGRRALHKKMKSMPAVPSSR